VRKSQTHQQVFQLLPALLGHAIASDVVTYSAAIRPAAPAGLTPLTCDAVPCRRAGCGHLQCCRQRVQKGQQHQQALLLLRALKRHAIVPDVITYGAAISVSNKCQRHQQASYLLRARRRYAIAPAVIACSTAISVCVMSKQHQQALHLLRAMQCQAIASDEVTYRAALRPAASAGLTSLSCDAVPCHRAGCSPLQYCNQRARVGRQHQQALHLLRRCGAMPSRRIWSPTALPSACVKIASSTSWPCISDERCCAMPSCRMWLPTVLQSACPNRPAAPVSLTSLTARRRHAIAQDVVTDSAAISVCGEVACR